MMLRSIVFVAVWCWSASASLLALPSITAYNVNSLNVTIARVMLGSKEKDSTDTVLSCLLKDHYRLESDGCDQQANMSPQTPYIAIVMENGCSMETKARNMQSIGAAAIIIVTSPMTPGYSTNIIDGTDTSNILISIYEMNVESYNLVAERLSKYYMGRGIEVVLDPKGSTNEWQAAYDSWVFVILVRGFLTMASLVVACFCLQQVCVNFNNYFFLLFAASAASSVYYMLSCSFAYPGMVSSTAFILEYSIKSVIVAVSLLSMNRWGYIMGFAKHYKARYYRVFTSIAYALIQALHGYLYITYDRSGPLYAVVTIFTILIYGYIALWIAYNNSNIQRLIAENEGGTMLLNTNVNIMNRWLFRMSSPFGIICLLEGTLAMNYFSYNVTVQYAVYLINSMAYVSIMWCLVAFHKNAAYIVATMTSALSLHNLMLANPVTIELRPVSTLGTDIETMRKNIVDKLHEVHIKTSLHKGVVVPAPSDDVVKTSPLEGRSASLLILGWNNTDGEKRSTDNWNPQSAEPPLKRTTSEASLNSVGRSERERRGSDASTISSTTNNHVLNGGRRATSGSAHSSNNEESIKSIASLKRGGSKSSIVVSDPNFGRIGSY